MNEIISEPRYDLAFTLQERLALAAIAQYDGDEEEIAEKAAEIIPDQLDVTKEEFEATIRSVVTQLSNVKLRETPGESKTKTDEVEV